MARDTSDHTSIGSIGDLTDYLAKGCKPEADFRIGTEHEKFGFFRDS
ncbi:gamma-glutamylcysteine synthetase, partial [Rhizobium aquaticum]